MLLAREELARQANGEPSAITIGVFDGVHRGHVHLISQTRAQGDDAGLQTGVITLHPAPETVLRPGKEPTVYLTSLDERMELLREEADWVAHVTFTSELAQISARDFVTLLMDVAGLRCLVEGPGFAFGRRREGTMEYLAELGAELGYEVVEAEPLVENGETVSSTLVRAALEQGDMERTTGLLGRPFSLRGPVVKGAERGRTIGFPTANIAVAPDRQLPTFGIYVTRSFVGEKAYDSVTNIGLRPTFDETLPTVEAYLLDFEGDLYGAEMRLDILHRLRDEARFESIDELKDQIDRDVVAAREYFAEERANA
ncbi:MAG TPA: riboflavin biosynthesis protein RibF [Dehalococcoidia bacterium]|nr:riboflavin biosynthesis protein RibF [Dehalococcoidia bacterium]